MRKFLGIGSALAVAGITEVVALGPSAAVLRRRRATAPPRRGLAIRRRPL